MRNFIEFFRTRYLQANKPWMILGKGPSFARLNDYDIEQFHILALNHVARELPVEVSHVIDMEVIESAGQEIQKNAHFVVMPWIPHVKMKPGTKDLAHWVENNETLKLLDQADRLLWYDLESGHKKNSDYESVQVRFFSSEAAIDLLALSGATTIRSLGIDGGTSYSTAFDDLLEKNRLANRVISFEPQFSEISKILNKHKHLKYGPLDSDFPAKIYIGASPREWLPAKVLEYSIVKNASLSTECRMLYDNDIEIPIPEDPRNRQRTAFSFQRFLIPQLNQGTGRAIYLDSDMLVLKDIRALWRLPFGSADLLCVNAGNEEQNASVFSVMVLDCERLNWKIEEIVAALDRQDLTYEGLMHDMIVANEIAQTIPPYWNEISNPKPGISALVHYTDLNRQPWFVRDNPHSALWMRHLFDAIDDGFITVDEVRHQVREGNVRPSLLRQIDLRMDEAFVDTLGEDGIRLDLDYIPSHLRKQTPDSALAGVKKYFQSLFGRND